jgi:hypothetical protein
MDAHGSGYGFGYALGWLVILGLFTWGLWKLVFDVARRPNTNAKCAYGLALALASWGIGMVLRGGDDASADARVLAVVVTLSLQVVAIVLAVMGLREVRREPAHDELGVVKGRGLAFWALALCSVPLIGAAASVTSRIMVHP